MSLNSTGQDGFGGLSDRERLRKALQIIRERGLPNFKPLLPLMLSLDGKPYTIEDHFPFEPLFSTHMPRKLTVIAGRQLSKSTSTASQGVILSSAIPNFNTLFVTPQFEMTRRFSSNYVRKFIEQSPVRALFVDTHTNNNVLQRSFSNGSMMFFSFALLDCDRTRGIAASKLAIDEVQDMDYTFIPIMREVLSASRWKLEQYTGTPKTLEGTLERLWQKSSMAEWVTKCLACGHWNIPSIDEDLDAMTGPTIVTREISERFPGLVCAKCGRPIYPRTGRWVHRYPERRFSHAGLHIPQHIMPMHFANAEAWAALLGKRAGFENTPAYAYYNECAGVSYDTGAKLVTLTDLKNAAVLHENRFEEAVKKVGNYKRTILAVDWGGGGEDETSYTTAAVLGILPNGKIDVIFGWRSLTPHDHFGEARRLIHLLVSFRCTHMVHDYSGAGGSRESIMQAAGVPLETLVPIAYVRAASGAMMRHIPENEATGQRAHYRVDKARSLVMTCQLIKKQWLRFFAFDGVDASAASLIQDFLALTEEKVSGRLGTDVYTVIRNEKAGPDDFAQAVNIGCCALFFQEGRWPDLADIEKLALTPGQIALLQPGQVDYSDW